MSTFWEWLGYTGNGNPPKPEEPPPPKPLSPQDAALLRLEKELKESHRDLQRHVSNMEREDIKKTTSIRQLVQDGDISRAKVEAKNQVRARRSLYRLQHTRDLMTRFQGELTILRANIALAKFGDRVNAILHSMNQVMDPAKVQNLVASLVQESKEQNLASDSITKALDKAFNELDGGAENSSDPELSEAAILARIEEEVGLLDKEMMPAAGTGGLQSVKQVAPVEGHSKTAVAAEMPPDNPAESAAMQTNDEKGEDDEADRELMERFDRLRGKNSKNS